jgi:hypothetical protein
MVQSKMDNGHKEIRPIQRRTKQKKAKLEGRAQRNRVQSEVDIKK